MSRATVRRPQAVAVAVLQRLAQVVKTGCRGRPRWTADVPTENRWPPTGDRRTVDPMSGQDVVDRFVQDGRLVIMPTKRAKRLLVLAHIAESFEPGHTYSETEVNEILLSVHGDYAALRRYLVDDEFLDRDGGVYWRPRAGRPR